MAPTTLLAFTWGNPLRVPLTLTLLILAATSTTMPAQELPAKEQAPAAAQQSLSCAEMEQFLREAQIGRRRTTTKGVTLPTRASLDNGKTQHDAEIQTIDQSKPIFQTEHGTELNFRDFWGFNVAAYELAKLLEINMVPPYVERRIDGTRASFSWWIPNVMMDEADRVRKKLPAPDPDNWNKEIATTHLFNQLVDNADENQTNILITRDWHVWMIDFTRAFRPTKKLRNPKLLTQCDPKLLQKMKELDKPMLEKHLKPYVTGAQIDGLLVRRDVIVSFFEGLASEKKSAFFSLGRVREACGTGL